MSGLQRQNPVLPAVFGSFDYKTIFALALISQQQLLAWGSAALPESASHALEGGQDPVD